MPAARTAALVALLWAASITAVRADPLGFGSFEVVYAPDGSWQVKPTHITPADLAKAVKDAIPNYKSILTITDACFSEIYLDEMVKQFSGDTAHTGPSTKTETSKTQQDRKTGAVSGYAPDLADELTGGKSIKDGSAAAAKKDPNNPNGDNGAVIQKKIENYERWRNSQPDPSKLPPAQREIPEHPQLKTTGTGEGIKFANGTSNHALIFVGLPAATDQKIREKYEASFKTAGFDSVTTLNDLKGGNVGDAPNPTWATIDNLKTSLKDIATHMNKDEHFVLVTLGHTVVEAQSNGTGAGQGVGGGLEVRHDRSTDDIPLDDETWSRLREQSTLQDSPAMSREFDPWFFLRTSEEHFAGDPLVTVSLNGIPIGVLQLLNSSFGGYYTLPIQLSLLPLILGTGNPGNIRVQFGFASDSDSIRLATLADLGGRDGAGSNYGTGIDAPFFGEDVEPVPEPASLVLLGTGVVGIVAARRRRRTTLRAFAARHVRTKN